MATNITSRHLNQDKRTAEAIVVTVPAVMQESAGRTLQPPKYYQYGDALVANVLNAGVIVQKTYLIVEEPFPTGATATVNANGITLFTDSTIDAKAVVVSTHEDIFVEAGATIEITINGGTGDITTGKLKVVSEILSTNLTNGNFANTII